MPTLEAGLGTEAAGGGGFMKEEAWQKTVNAIEGIGRRLPGSILPPDEHAPNGYYKDPSCPGKPFPIIGRDSEVNGGVYIGEGAREIILVEAKKKKEEKGSLEGLYEWVKTSLEERKKENPQWGEQDIIKAIYEMICERMKYDSKEVNRITEGKKDHIVALEEFLEKGVGVCRHQSLAGSYPASQKGRSPS